MGHFLNVRVFQCMRKSCAAMAARVALHEKQKGIPHPLGTPLQMHQKAAAAGIRAASICECMEASCGAGADCKIQHPACPEMFIEVFCAVQELLATGTLGGGDDY